MFVSVNCLPFTVRSHTLYYKPSLGIGICFRDLKGEVIIKKYGNTCLFTGAAAEQSLIAPFGPLIILIVFCTVHFLNKIY